MYFLKLLIFLGVIFGTSCEKSERYRDKRQQYNQNGHKSGNVPPYAVPMDPIPIYSQRDPLYNQNTAQSKSDDSGYYEEGPYNNNYYPTEPEPIIEIIIKESNESLPAYPQPTPPPVRPKKEPIQVFYVKYEKKQEYGEDKPRVVYDPPVPALTPVEEHEVVGGNPDHHVQEEDYAARSRPDQPLEPSTTLRTIIKPDSEVYHSGGSGIKVTFGTEELPPNSHNKRSDKELTTEKAVKPLTSISPAGSSKRPHGPFAPLNPTGPRVTSAFPQQRIINSFSNQQLLGPHPTLAYQQQLPSFTHPPPTYHQSIPPHVRTTHQPHLNNQRHQRPPINVQGLPEYRQRVQFTSFVPPHRVNINHPQHPGQAQATSVSHQNVQLHNYPQPPSSNAPAIFNHDAPFKFKPHHQSQEKPTRYFQPQQRPNEHQILQEQQRIAEQQRRKLEQEHKHQYHHHHHYHQQQKLQNHLQNQQHNQYQHQEFKVGTSIQTQPSKQSEIVKAIPKLEQHYAIRENPLHPGPFPPNPQHVTTTTFGIFQNTNQFTNSHHQSTNLVTPIPNHRQQQQHQYHQQQQQQQQLDNYSKQKLYQSEQSFFAQNLPTPQQQRPTSPEPEVSPWQRPIYKGKYSSQKIFATPVTKTNDENIYKGSSTPNSLHFAPTTYKPITFNSHRYSAHSQLITTVTPPTTTTTTTTTQSTQTEAKVQANIANLPDEVPEDIRQQLLSSGILGNADIQVLDYDKVGGINLENLPPEALANFYSAGGASATSAASEPIPQLAKKPKRVNLSTKSELQIAQSSSNLAGKSSSGVKSTEGMTLRPGGVEMKVVRFDPNTAQGQYIAEKHIDSEATRLNPVPVVNDRNNEEIASQYNRYIPLKVSGASFPIPNVPELSGKRISSVVVLAPVDYTYRPEDIGLSELAIRQGKKFEPTNVQAIKFLAGDSLKQLMKKPSAENYKRWLEQEKISDPQKQSVVLLVTAASSDKSGDKEIYMYDVLTQTVNKLAGNLSSAFVDAAESNASVPISEAIN